MYDNIVNGCGTVPITNAFSGRDDSERIRFTARGRQGLHRGTFGGHVPPSGEEGQFAIKAATDKACRRKRSS